MGTSYGTFPHSGLYNDCRNDLLCEHQCYQDQCYLPISCTHNDLFSLQFCYKQNQRKWKENPIIYYYKAIYMRDLQIKLSNTMCFCMLCSTGDV